MWGYQPYSQAETNHKRASKEVMLSGLQIHIHPSNLHPVSQLTVPSLGLLSRHFPQNIVILQGSSVWLSASLKSLPNPTEVETGPHYVLPQPVPVETLITLCIMWQLLDYTSVPATKA